MAAIFAVDMEKMGAHMESPEFQALIEPHVASHEIYIMQLMQPPQEQRQCA